MRHEITFGIALFDGRGRRKYLTAVERRRFYSACEAAEPGLRLLAQLLSLTGCRISEALELTRERLDLDAGVVVFRTLKRRKCVFRAVPVPAPLLRELQTLASARAEQQRIWPWCRQTAWRKFKTLMETAQIVGPAASPKGLRHGFGIAAAEANLPIGITQKMMGHARLETTTIYQNAIGQEERQFMQRLWRNYTSA